MELIDDRGRILGKVNIIDAAALLVAGLLIPLAYGAYLLFRPAPVRITTIEPASIPLGTQQVTLRGEHLRPFLRAKVGPHPSVLLFGSPTESILQLPVLVPGSYDVTLLDEDQPIETLPNALTVASPGVPGVTPAADSAVPVAALSAAQVNAVGVFVLPDAAGAQALASALRRLKGSDWGSVVAVEPPQPTFRYLQSAPVAIADGSYRVAAVLRLRCALVNNECMIGGRVVAPGASLPLSIGLDSPSFLVDELHSVDTQSVEVDLRAAVDAEVLELLERDQAQAAAQRELSARAALRPSVVDVRVVSVNGADGSRSIRLGLRVPAVRIAGAWRYQREALRAGRQFSFEQDTYGVSGTVLTVRPTHAVATR